VNQNNYKATAADLAEPPAAVEPRPRAVNIALVLAGLALLIPLLADLKALQDAQFQFGNLRYWMLYGGQVVLLCLLYHQMAHGRNWARVIYLILVLLTFAKLFWTVGGIVRLMPEQIPMLYGPTFIAARWLPLALNLVALHLLYFSSGNWFARR
jgi:hypothetical protein